jgi:hypothetical protein
MGVGDHRRDCPRGGRGLAAADRHIRHAGDGARRCRGAGWTARVRRGDACPDGGGREDARIPGRTLPWSRSGGRWRSHAASRAEAAELEDYVSVSLDEIIETGSVRFTFGAVLTACSRTRSRSRPRRTANRSSVALPRQLDAATHKGCQLQLPSDLRPDRLNSVYRAVHVGWPTRRTAASAHADTTRVRVSHRRVASGCWTAERLDFIRFGGCVAAGVGLGCGFL